MVSVQGEALFNNSGFKKYIYIYSLRLVLLFSIYLKNERYFE